MKHVSAQIHKTYANRQQQATQKTWGLTSMTITIVIQQRTNRNISKRNTRTRATLYMRPHLRQVERGPQSAGDEAVLVKQLRTKPNEHVFNHNNFPHKEWCWACCDGAKFWSHCRTSAKGSLADQALADVTTPPENSLTIHVKSAWYAPAWDSCAFNLVRSCSTSWSMH